MTWDENDLERAELNEKLNTGKVADIPDADLRKFVAYSSEEEDDVISEHSDEEQKSDNETEAAPTKKSKKKVDVISKYKNLLNDINKKEQEKKKNKIEMEFSWGIDTSSKQEKVEKKSIETELTPFEKIIEKKREKKREHKRKMRKLKKESNQSGHSDSDNESEEDLPDGIDLNDPYFAEEFANDEFAPTKSKKSKNKKKQTKNDEDESDIEAQKDLELLLDDDDHKAHFSLKKIQERENETKASKKRRKKLKNKLSVEDKKVVEDDFKVNVSDNRFSAIYSSHLFNIDPTDSHYRKTKAMETLIQEKLKRKSSDINGKGSTENGEPTEKKRRDVADSILIKSIKRKVKQQA